MKRSASNLIIILLLVVIIVGVIVYASDKQLAPSYAPADGSASGDASLPAGAAGLVLSELMVENDGAVRDEDGDYPRWVELYNSTSAELSLSGYSLSDRENDATKYPLPAITLAPGEYRVVFLSGKNRTAADGNLHTGFKVNGSETLYLFSGSTIVDSVSGAATSSNISKIKVGSAAPLAEELDVEVNGRDVMSGLPKTVRIESEEIRRALDRPLDEVTKAVKDALDVTPPDLASDLMYYGILLTGGGGLLRGLDQRLREETGVPVNVSPTALENVVNGCAKVLEANALSGGFVQSTGQ